MVSLRQPRSGQRVVAAHGNSAMKETKGKPKKVGAPKPNASQPSTKGLPASPAKGR